jgi:hypothetical protein
VGRQQLHTGWRQHVRPIPSGHLLVLPGRTGWCVHPVEPGIGRAVTPSARRSSGTQQGVTQLAGAAPSYGVS